jgi:subtilisin family serine protease/subtilisin-like proprotein convertase family protein
MKKRQPRDLFTASGEAFSVLEPRMLLSGDSGTPATATMQWHGVDVETLQGSWVVTFSELLGRDQATERTAEVAAALGVRTSEIRPIGRGGFAAFDTPDALDEEDVARALRLVPGVMQIEPNAIRQMSRLSNDPQFGQQWGHQNSGQEVPPLSGNFGVLGADTSIPEAWDITIGSGDVIVAVIDTGVDWTHPDLAANIWSNPGEIAGNGIDDDGNGYVDDVRGYDFADGDNDPSDVEGHGTGVAGVIGAVGNNAIGISGVAWTVKILPLKIFRNVDITGAAVEWIVAAQDYATDVVERGYNLVASNNSYGGVAAVFFQEFRAAEEQAIQRFTNTGATFVAAAGNDSLNNDEVFQSFPASYNNPEIISVASTNNRDELSDFSNYGLRNVDLAAPGEQILTTAPAGGYQYIDGTSFSAPYVTGAVALLKAFKPNASQEEVKRALIEGCDPLPSLQNRVVSGGRLNVAAALRRINIEGPEVTAIFPGPVSADVSAIRISFNKELQTPISSTFITLRAANGDAVFDNDDIFITVNDGMLSYDGSTLTIDLSGSFPGGLPVDFYRVTLDADGFRDLNGNYLNGNSSVPTPDNDETYVFQVTTSSGAFEPNDTIPNATPVVFNANGHAEFVNAAIGDGLSDVLDVDLYRVFMSGPGLLVAAITAQHLPLPSSLDSYLRLFDANGNTVGLPVNDNFDGLDSRLEFFVPTGGVYYIGVSGFGNDDYNPDVVASGSAQSLGDYSLNIDVSIDATDSFSSNATGVPVAIPDAVGGTAGRVTSTITIADTREVVDLNVRISIAHPFVGDLQVRLIAPDGRTVALVLNRGTSGDNFTGTIFDDEAGSPISGAFAPFTGSFRPEVALNTLDGISAAGTWTLEVRDTKQLDVGTLTAWGIDFTVRNNIFGLFELNDTIGLATDLGVAGTGTVTRDADIGDGAFGLRDVDLFRFTAAPGTTLTASLNVLSGQLDTILRLFDAGGNELIIDNRMDTTGATITFTIDQGATFYLGVSGAGNAMYSVLAGGSGAPTSATGSYRLRVNVVGGISNGSVVTSGNTLSVGVNSDGSIGIPPSGSGGTGLSLNGIDFLVPQNGTAFESFFGGIFDGFIFRNAGQGNQSDLSVSISNESDFSNRRISVEGTFRGLGVRRTLSFGAADTFVAVDVTLTNTTGSSLSNLAWMEAVNPQIGLNRNSNVARTVNNVQNATGRLVTGTYTDNDFPNGLTLAMGAPLANGVDVYAATEPLNSIRDPFQIINDNTRDPDPSGDTGVAADELLAMAFDVGTLNSGSEVSFRYFFFLGTSLNNVNAQFNALEAGTGTGHLVADPESGTIDEASLPYAIYYPEGYANSRASTFVPIVNPNQGDARVVVIAHYERDFSSEVLYDSAVNDIDGDSVIDGTIRAHTRSGLTITTPDLYASNQLLVRKDEPYSLEIRSSQPVGANLSHFDFGVATGEAFTSTRSTAWTVAEGYKGTGVNDYLVFYNPTSFVAKVTLTIYPESGAAAFALPLQEVGPGKRGGWSLADVAQIPNGPFGMKITADHEVVVALSHYDQNIGGGFGVLAQPNLGSLKGATPEGQYGINATEEFVTILNPNPAAASVAFTFFFADGSSYREQVNVPANRRSGFAISSLPNFPAGQPYSIAYESTQAVTMTLPSYSFGEATGSEFVERAHGTWIFADGFKPTGDSNQVTEYLRLYNPTTAPLSVEITMSFNDGSSETFRRTIAARTASEFNIFDFVTGARDNPGTVPGVGSFYGLRVRAAQPILAYMGHFDQNFFGGFGTIGYGLDEGVVIS